MNTKSFINTVNNNFLIIGFNGYYNIKKVSFANK